MTYIPPRSFLLFLIVVVAMALGSMVFADPLSAIPAAFAASLTWLVLVATVPRPEPQLRVREQPERFGNLTPHEDD